MIINEVMLAAFVQASDERGGPNSPGCNAYWHAFTYQPSTCIDETLDPFGTEYMEAQLALYREVSGRNLDQAANEQTNFDLRYHVAAANPYGQHDPAATAMHIQRLACAIKAARPHLGAQMLDMGCGWGLSSEFAAYLGLEVTGVDINPEFVSLVNQRATLRRFQVKAVNATFDSYVPDRAFDLILFYECLHHAVKPWAVVERLATSLAPGGAIVLAGEPINEAWRHWGIRLDALSVYCIRKFGWFESGWSLDFIKTVFARANMAVEASYDPVVGHTLVARGIPPQRVALARIAQDCSVDGWYIEPDYLVLQDVGLLTIRFPEDTKAATLNFMNYRGSAVGLRISHAGHALFEGSVDPGANGILVPRLATIMECKLQGEVWVPNAELANGDHRSLSVHLAGITIV